MPIRQQTQGVQETLDGMEQAASEKIEVGFNPLTDGSSVGIELMGFATEMLLKSAYFRFIGHPGSDAITRQHLTQAEKDAHILSVVASPESFHSVEFWGELLIKQRRSQSRPLSALMENDLHKSVQKVHRNWHVTMRYQSIKGIQKSDLDDVFDGVMWIKSNYEALWR